MKFDQLVYFAETARLQHIGKASKSLHISPSAISHSIKSLETELGCRLFQRQGKNIYLTAHGKKLHEKARNLLNLTNNIKEEFKNESIEWEGTYRVAVTHVLSGCFFVPRWNEFQHHHPDLHIELYNMRSSQIIEQVAKGEVDFGLCFNPTSHPDVIFETIDEQPLVIGLRKKHPLVKKKRSEQLKLVSTYPCASPKAFRGVEICENHSELKKYQITSRIDFVFDSYESAIARIQETNSWTLLPKSLVERYGLSSVVPPGWNAKAKIVAVWPRNRLLSKTLQKLKAFLRGN